MDRTGPGDRTGPEGDDPRARLVSAVETASSAALNVLFDGHAAVPEERAGQRLQQRPGVGAGVKGLHVAQGRTLAAHDAARGVDFTVQDHGAAETRVAFVIGDIQDTDKHFSRRLEVMKTAEINEKNSLISSIKRGNS